MDFQSLNRMRDIEERIAALEAAVQVLQEHSARAEAVADIAARVDSLTDWRDSQRNTRTLTLGNKDRSSPGQAAGKGHPA